MRVDERSELVRVPRISWTMTVSATAVVFLLLSPVGPALLAVVGLGGFPLARFVWLSRLALIHCAGTRWGQEAKKKYKLPSVSCLQPSGCMYARSVHRQGGITTGWDLPHPIHSSHSIPSSIASPMVGRKGGRTHRGARGRPLSWPSAALAGSSGPVRLPCRRRFFVPRRMLSRNSTQGFAVSFTGRH